MSIMHDQIQVFSPVTRWKDVVLLLYKKSYYIQRSQEDKQIWKYQVYYLINYDLRFITPASDRNKGLVNLWFQKSQNNWLVVRAFASMST